MRKPGNSVGSNRDLLSSTHSGVLVPRRRGNDVHDFFRNLLDIACGDIGAQSRHPSLTHWNIRMLPVPLLVQ